MNPLTLSLLPIPCDLFVTKSRDIIEDHFLQDTDDVLPLFKESRIIYMKTHSKANLSEVS